MPPGSPEFTNKLLSTLPAADRDRIARNLVTVPIAFKQVLYKQDETISDVYFPAVARGRSQKQWKMAGPPK
jgi:hypothetical protein